MSKWDAVWAAADTWQRVALVAIIVAAIGQTSFIAVYARRPWWRHFVGRALFLKSASLMAILVLSVVNTFFVYPGQEPIAAAVLIVTTVAIWYQFAALISTPRDAYPPDDRHDGVGGDNA